MNILVRSSKPFSISPFESNLVAWSMLSLNWIMVWTTQSNSLVLNLPVNSLIYFIKVSSFALMLIAYCFIRWQLLFVDSIRSSRRSNQFYPDSPLLTLSYDFLYSRSLLWQKILQMSWKLETFGSRLKSRLNSFFSFLAISIYLFDISMHSLKYSLNWISIVSICFWSRG